GLFIEPADKYLHHGADHSNPAKQRTNGEDKHHHYEGDRRLHYRQHDRRMQEFAQNPEIAHRLGGTPRHAPQVRGEHRHKNTVAQFAIQRQTRGEHDLPSRPLQQFHHHIGTHDHDDQHQQSGVAAAVDHAVVNLQHE